MNRDGAFTTGTAESLLTPPTTWTQRRQPPGNQGRGLSLDTRSAGTLLELGLPVSRQRELNSCVTYKPPRLG